MTGGGLTVYLLGGGFAGFVAAMVMVLPMGRQSDGWTPAFIAAAALARTTPEAISMGRASVVHHVTGLLAGSVYGILLYGLSGSIHRTNWYDVSVVNHIVAVTCVVVGVYLVFAHLVLPRAGGEVYEERATAVRGQWVRSTLTFAAALAVVGPPAIILMNGVFGTG